MTPAALLADLSARGIIVAANTGNLKVSAPAGALTDADRAAIRDHKPALVAYLTPPLSPGLLTALRQAGATIERIPDGWRFTPNGCARWLEVAVDAQLRGELVETAIEVLL